MFARYVLRASDGRENCRSLMSVICDGIKWFDSSSYMGVGVTKVKLFIMCVLCILGSLKCDKIKRYTQLNIYKFATKSRLFRLIMRNVSDKVVEKI